MRAALILTLAATGVLAGCGPRHAAPTAEVSDAWVRLAALPDRPGAGYFRIEVNNPRESLLEVSSPSAERIELHATADEGGRTAMRAIGEAPTEDGTAIVFAPGGRHLMIHGLDPSLRPGDTLELRFRFRLAPPAAVRARIVAAGDEAPHAGH